METDRMSDIRAIGFDLFNTLITVDPKALREALSRLMGSLARSGIPVDPDTYVKAHREAVFEYIRESTRDGRETHNRFWISAALKAQGHDILPDDPRIATAVEFYFSAFYDHCRRIPGTRRMLEGINGRYRIGLLSNFTHPPAAHKILETVGLASYFDVVLISGDLGYRKPHPMVFERLIDALGAEPHQILFVGDDPEPDITGALNAGIRPVWTTYVRDNDLPLAPGIQYSSGEPPQDGVSRISSWDDFITLLNGP